MMRLQRKVHLFKEIFEIKCRQNIDPNAERLLVQIFPQYKHRKHNGNDRRAVFWVFASDLGLFWKIHTKKSGKTWRRH